ncbi:hypothetical protein, partial [Acinetobacter baumannii]|uniref:hypothetical protein n=1 Tax=Acinetobacter baumannii TaxID=470 RepID=UPI00196B27CE
SRVGGREQIHEQTTEQIKKRKGNGNQGDQKQTSKLHFMGAHAEVRLLLKRRRTPRNLVACRR